MSKFVLVRWMEEETLSVMGATSVKNGQEIYRGAIADFKWGGKTFYEGEILAMSGKLRVGRTVASLNTSLSVFRFPMIVIVCFFVVDNRQSLNHDLEKMTKLEKYWQDLNLLCT